MIIIELKQPNRTVLGPLIKTSEAAELLACTSRKITDMCRKGEIKAVKVGSDWRINTAAFLKQFGLIDEVDNCSDAGEADVEEG